MKVLGTLRGKRCLVVGSAPNMVLPEYHGSHDRVIGANGGAALGGTAVDVFVTTTHLFRPRPTRAEAETVRILSGLRADVAMVDTLNAPLQQAVDGFRRADIRCAEVYPVSPDEREEVVQAAVGLPMGHGPTHSRVSTGVFAACLAVASGARSVTLCGISLRNGHYNMPWDTSLRHHVPADKQCIYALLETGKVDVIAEDLLT